MGLWRRWRYVPFATWSLVVMLCSGGASSGSGVGSGSGTAPHSQPGHVHHSPSSSHHAHGGGSDPSS
jgi:hypothetical protein